MKLKEIKGLLPEKKENGKYLVVVDRGVYFLPYESTSEGEKWDEPMANAIHATIAQIAEKEIELDVEKMAITIYAKMLGVTEEEVLPAWKSEDVKTDQKTNAIKYARALSNNLKDLLKVKGE